MENKLSNEQFEQLIAEQWHTLNRKQKRLYKYKPDALRHIIGNGKKYELIQNNAGTFVTTELRSNVK